MSAKVWSICSKGCDKYQNNGASAFTCCIGQICKISGLLKLHLQNQNGLKLTYINAAAEKMSLYLPYVIPLPPYYRQQHGYLGMPSSGFRSWTGWKPGQKRGEKNKSNPRQQQIDQHLMKRAAWPAENTGALTSTGRGAEDNHLSVAMWT